MIFVALGFSSFPTVQAVSRDRRTAVQAIQQYTGASSHFIGLHSSRSASLCQAALGRLAMDVLLMDVLGHPADGFISISAAGIAPDCE